MLLLQVRSLLPLLPSSNLRLRVLPHNTAVVEADQHLLPLLEADDAVRREVQERLRALGLRFTGCRPFKSGSVARKEEDPAQCILP